jgi:hypothetical protein
MRSQVEILKEIANGDESCYNFMYRILLWSHIGDDVVDKENGCTPVDIISGAIEVFSCEYYHKNRTVLAPVCYMVMALFKASEKLKDDKKLWAFADYARSAIYELIIVCATLQGFGQAKLVGYIEEFARISFNDQRT